MLPQRKAKKGHPSFLPLRALIPQRPRARCHTGKRRHPLDQHQWENFVSGVLPFPAGGRPSGRTGCGAVICEGSRINIAPMPVEAVLTFSPMAHRVEQETPEGGATSGRRSFGYFFWTSKKKRQTRSPRILSSRRKEPLGLFFMPPTGNRDSADGAPAQRRTSVRRQAPDTGLRRH